MIEDPFGWKKVEWHLHSSLPLGDERKAFP
jgi:hypothetical protein